MSFSDSVREELYSRMNDQDKKYACLYGILLYCRMFTASRIRLQSESPVFAKLIPDLFHAVFGKDVPLVLRTAERETETGMVQFVLSDPEWIARICETYRIRLEQREIYLTNLVNNSTAAFLSGVFFICGSMVEPQKEYHLEFMTPSEMLCQDLQKLLQSIQVRSGMVQRKNMYVLYLKDSAHIEDTLTFMGAQQCTLELMNIKIHKDVRNKANRIRNCDAANIDKVVAASAKQVDDIHLIESVQGLESLPVDLLELAQLRLENPELSLKELGDLLTVPIGRSGVNHRFQKIAAIAGEIRTNAIHTKF